MWEDEDNGFDSFDSGVDPGSFAGNSDDGFGELNGDNEELNDGDKKQIVKQAVILVAIGVILIVVAISLRGFIKNFKLQPSEPKKPQTTTSQPAQQSNTHGNTQNKSSEWKAFAKDEIEFNSEKVSCTFTITGIEHQVRVVSNVSELQVRTILTGNLSGFTGSYQIEVPYSKGCLLSIGKMFNVEVEVGSKDDFTVIGTISY